MPYHKVPLSDGEVYHVFTKSIAGFRVFNSDDDYKRLIDSIVYYSAKKVPCRYSDFTGSDPGPMALDKNTERIVSIIAYCVMPTHIHIVLKQLAEEGITRLMSCILKSHSKYFNTRHGRKGPLWEGRFKRVLVKTDEQLLHLTRYVHLNPTTAYLVNGPHEWPFSSYQEYATNVVADKKICVFGDLLDIEPEAYRKFTEDRIAYQRELSKITNLTLD
jgi:putative transposase